MHSVFSVTCAIVVQSSLLRPSEELLQIHSNLIPSEPQHQQTPSAGLYTRLHCQCQFDCRWE